MTQQQLNNAFDSGLVIRFDSKTEQYKFLQEVKSFGGSWQNGEEITLPENAADLETIFNLHIDRSYRLSRVSAMCYHFGIFPTLQYKNFRPERI